RTTWPSSGCSPTRACSPCRAPASGCPGTSASHSPWTATPWCARFPPSTARFATRGGGARPGHQKGAPRATAEPRPSRINLVHVIYALHAASLITGIIGTATIVGAFLTGWPSIIAVILNYVKRSEAAGTWLESHFRWQIRTFWFGLLWVMLCLL